MVARADKVYDILFGPQQIIQMAEPAMSFFKPAGIKVILLLSQNDNRLRCHSGKEIGMVQPESKRPMDAKAFLRGHAVAPGQRFGDGVTDKHH